MSKDKICAVCQFCLYNHEADSFVCHNEQSAKFGKVLSHIDDTKSLCEDFSPHRYEDMTLKEALGIITFSDLRSAYPANYLRTKMKDRPFIVLEFENNSDALEWKDALTRLFTELMDIKEKDGDFKEKDDNSR